MRISDWSSDVCSSDLHFERLGLLRDVGIPLRHMRHEACGKRLAERRMRHAERLEDMVLDIGVEIFAADALDDIARERGRVIGIGRRRAGREDAFGQRSEEHTSELQSLMRISYAVFCLKKKKKRKNTHKKTRKRITDKKNKDSI